MRETSLTMTSTSRHVVVVRVPTNDDVLLVPLRDLQNLLIRYLRKQPPGSDYSILIMRQEGVPEVHCSFSESMDAERLATALHGVQMEAKEGEASRRFVELDDDILCEVVQVAGPPSFKKAKPDASSEEGRPMRSIGAMRRR
ncbi:MAG: hypothetical protein U1E60_11715 [Reyranellaceae bacterium]